jgi:hypothetical protein
MNITEKYKYGSEIDVDLGLAEWLKCWSTYLAIQDPQCSNPRSSKRKRKKMDMGSNNSFSTY